MCKLESAVFHPIVNLFGMGLFLDTKEFISTYDHPFYDNCSLLVSQDNNNNHQMWFNGLFTTG